MEKLKPSACLSCCFRGTDVDSLAHEYRPNFRAREKCRIFISRAERHRRRHSTGNFGYDPLSYALNFDEGPDFKGDAEISASEYKYRNFSSRLPQTPPQATLPTKEVACS